MVDQSSPKTYTNLPYELRNAILLAAIDSELPPFVHTPDHQIHAKIAFSKYNNYNTLNLALKTLEALSQIPSLWQHDGLASAAKHHIHRVAEYYASWKILHLNRTLRPGQARWPLDEAAERPWLQYQMYEMRFTRFAREFATIMRLNDVAAFDRMVTEVKCWNRGSSEASEDYDMNSYLFMDLTWVYERALREREEASS